MKYPNKLQQGGTVGLVCPSSSVSTERVQECADTIKKMGFVPKLSDNLDRSYKGLMAGTGQERADLLNAMFADPDVDAIFCVRGGDGSSRIMEYLDYDLIRKNPKIFVGYSDITNLHLAITQNCDFVTFHGPMVSSNMVNNFDDETKNSFFNAINADADYEFHNPKGFEIGVLSEGKASGKLIGGNLSLLSASVGTPYQMDTNGNIIFIEEVDEPTSKIEKWMYHLRNAGLLEKASGIVLGQFTDMSINCDEDFDAVSCIADVCGDLGIPIMYNIQSGHGFPMMTLPMGADCGIDTANGTIKIKVER